MRVRRPRTGAVAKVWTVLAIAVVVAACGVSASPSPAPAQSNGASATPATASGQLVVAEPTPPDTFDPIMASNYNNWYAWQLVYETLLVVKPDGSLAPMLATSWDASPDGLTYTFHLRSGVKFQDGSAFTSDDVVFTFDRLKSDGIPYAQARFPSLESVTAVDPQTVTFKLSKKDSSFLSNLGDPFVVAGAILSRTAAGKNDPKTTMVGTGPLRMVSYAAGSELDLEANPGYWGTPPGVAKLTIKYIADPQSAVAALLSGSVSVIWPSPEAYASLKSNGQVKILSVPSAVSFQMNMSSGKAPLDNIDVRRAIALSIDRDAVVKSALLGEGQPTGPFPPSHGWAVPLDQQPNYQRDVAQAKQLLAQAGFADGLDLKFMYPTLDSVYPLVAQAVQSQLAEAGIRATLEPLDTNVWVDRLTRADYDITMVEPPYYGDPSLYVIPRKGRQGPTPPELQALLDQAASATYEQLADIYKQIQISEATLVYPFTGIVAQNKWVAYRPDLVSGVALDYTLSRRLYLGLQQAGQ